MVETERDSGTDLRAENARLIALLESHGIEWRRAFTQARMASPEGEHSRLDKAQKIALFRRLFRGRADVYAIRWEGKTSGKSGYSPACANEWRAGVCEKPRIKCSDCAKRALIPLSDEAIYGHLVGDQTIGIYPLLTDAACYFLAVDFDETEWRQDALAFAQSCRDLGVSTAVEISRSGNGAHVWLFFAERVPAPDARRLGVAIISYTCARTRQLKLKSYDRLFPNQDSVPKGGLGNLIALPLQKAAREKGCSVFVNEALRPFDDQWAFLASIKPMRSDDLEPAILRATGGSHPLDVTFIDEEDNKEPWKHIAPPPGRLPGPMPEVLNVTLANLVYFKKAELPQPLSNRLIRLAAFQNPEFYRAQAMRLTVWDKPRVIGCAENYPEHIALPRGCLEAAQSLLGDNGIRCNFTDQRFTGVALNASFAGKLRPDQDKAVKAMLRYETGVLCAPTAFGKTVAAAALIAERGVNALVLVHRTDLLRQWQERLRSFLYFEDGLIGTIGGGKAKPTGKIDIAVMQALSRNGTVDPLVENYGHIIVDECHHVGAVSFDAILKRVRARYVLGLTATPIRRDGQQPIIFMQCGPVRHVAVRHECAPYDLEVTPRLLEKKIDLPHDTGIQDVFRYLAADIYRTKAIASEAEGEYRKGRKVLVLTERTEHLEAILSALEGLAARIFKLHGRMSKNQRAALLSELDALPPEAPRILLSTGKLIGEGFDHPPLNTLVLGMPISWKGTLQQYAGRLHRDHTTKTDVRIIDFVDTGHPALVRMWEKRRRGYRAMGYRFSADDVQ